MFIEKKLSPILFVLAMDLLHKRIKNRIKGVKPMEDFERIPIVGFADDTALFPKNHFHLKRCLRILHHFKLATGMEIAIHKCSYVTKNPKSETRLRNLNMKPIPDISEKITERYLGAELHSKGVKDTLSSRIDKAIKKMEMLRGVKYIHQRAKVVKTFIWPMLYYWFSFEELSKEDASRLNTATWNYVYTGHPSYNAKIGKIKRLEDANKFSDGGIGLFDIWEFANHQNAKQYHTALSKQNDQLWAHKWINKPNKKARNYKKKWKKITFEQNMKDLDEWKSYQPKLTKINLETPSSPKIWKQILSLPVHPTVKNFVFKRCRRMIRTFFSMNIYLHRCCAVLLWRQSTCYVA